MAIKKGSHIISRKVGLFPKDRGQRELIESAFIRARELSNEITEFLFKKAFNSNAPSVDILEHFEKTTKHAQKKNIYEFYKLNNLDHTFHHDGIKYSLNKRISRFILDHAFLAVRNQLLRRHDLVNIIDVTTTILSDSSHEAHQNILYHLISGMPMRYKTGSLTTGEDIELFSLFSQNLQNDVFEKKRKGKESFSLHYFNNHFLQIRNLMLKQKTINPFFKNRLKDLQKAKMTDIYQEIYADIIKDYTKEELDIDDNSTLKTLFDKLLTRFISTIKTRTLRVAK